MKIANLHCNELRESLDIKVLWQPIFYDSEAKEDLVLEYWRLSRLRYGVLGPSLANQLVADVRED